MPEHCPKGGLNLIEWVPETLKDAVRWVNRHRPGAHVRWGGMRRLTPMSNCYGFDRGKPVDRWYVERFLDARSHDITGRVAEIGARLYTERFGRNVERSVVVDINPSNRRATVVADLCERGSLAAISVDCFILTQTLHLLRDPRAALVNVTTSLAPGGVLLLTAPCASRIDPDLADTDSWRFTPAGLSAYLREIFPGAAVDVTGHGNLLAMVAFLYGIAAEELAEDELGVYDPAHPLLACARVSMDGG